MADMTMIRPTIWLMRALSSWPEDDPTIRSTFSMDSDISSIQFYRADEYDADDSSWTLLGTVARPSLSALSDFYVEQAHSGAGQSTTHYYRARQIGSTYVGPWSNVIRSNRSTFLFDLRDAWDLLRAVQLDINTDNSVRRPTWFEAMNIMATIHQRMDEFLRRFFSFAVIDQIYDAPPGSLADMARASVSEMILHRSELTSEERKERIKLAREAKYAAEADFLQGGRVILSDTTEITFNASSVRAG